MSTNKVSAKDIQRQWHLIDAKNKILGRLATEVATLLMGKGRPNYVPYLDMGDNIVVINAGKIKVKYVRHSGYPGGLKEETLEGLRTRKPEEVVIHAISGMIPKSKLGRQIIKKLHVYSGSEHPFKKELKEEKGDE